MRDDRGGFVFESTPAVVASRLRRNGEAMTKR